MRCRICMCLLCVHVQFGEEVSVAGTVALVSELSVNESQSPQPYSTVSGGDVPAAHWDKESSSSAVRFCLLLSVYKQLNAHLSCLCSVFWYSTECNSAFVERVHWYWDMCSRYSVLELKNLTFFHVK